MTWQILIEAFAVVVGFCCVNVVCNTLENCMDTWCATKLELQEQILRQKEENGEEVG